MYINAESRIHQNDQRSGQMNTSILFQTSKKKTLESRYSMCKRTVNQNDQISREEDHRSENDPESKVKLQNSQINQAVKPKTDD
jgi:hypothetical protein